MLPVSPEPTELALLLAISHIHEQSDGGQLNGLVLN